MAKIGTQQKFSTLEQQREAAELELIIEDFGRAMRDASREYIAKRPGCQHASPVQFTLNMRLIWHLYVDFCERHPE